MLQVFKNIDINVVLLVRINAALLEQVELI